MSEEEKQPEPEQAEPPESVEQLKARIQQLNVQVDNWRGSYESRGRMLERHQTDLQHASVEITRLRGKRSSLVRWAIAGYLAAALVSAFAGWKGGASSEHGLAVRAARLVIRREATKVQRAEQAKRCRWRSGICTQTCQGLGFRTLDWTMASVDLSNGPREEVCRCGTPDGVLFVQDSGRTQLVENQTAKRRNDENWRRVRQLEAMGCASGMLSEQECQMDGHPWRGGR